jgi:MFS family permease
MLKVVKPRYYLAGCCIGWGGMAAAQAAATGFASLGAIRFLLGLFEASFAPGCAFYLSFWYTKV